MPTDLRTILQLEVPVIVQIAERKMSMDDLLALGPGAILEFHKSADEPLDLMINNKPIGHGAAVKLGENFGLRLKGLGSTAERLEALSGVADE